MRQSLGRSAWYAAIYGILAGYEFGTGFTHSGTIEAWVLVAGTAMFAWGVFSIWFTYAMDLEWELDSCAIDRVDRGN
jgi:hypothetical protein